MENLPEYFEKYEEDDYNDYNDEKDEGEDDDDERSNMIVVVSNNTMLKCYNLNEIFNFWPKSNLGSRGIVDRSCFCFVSNHNSGRSEGERYTLC